jgi:hypothetical protein
MRMSARHSMMELWMLDPGAGTIWNFTKCEHVSLASEISVFGKVWTDSSISGAEFWKKLQRNGNSFRFAQLGPGVSNIASWIDYSICCEYNSFSRSCLYIQLDPRTSRATTQILLLRTLFLRRPRESGGEGMVTQCNNNWEAMKSTACHLYNQPLKRKNLNSSPSHGIVFSCSHLHNSRLWTLIVK